MYVIRTVHGVASRGLEVDVGRPLVEVGCRCPPLLACSIRPMRHRMMSLGTDVGLHEVTMFSMRYSIMSLDGVAAKVSLMWSLMYWL